MKISSRWWLLLAFLPAVITSAGFEFLGRNRFILFAGATFAAGIMLFWTAFILKKRGHSLNKSAKLFGFGVSWLSALCMLHFLGSENERETAMIVLAIAGMITVASSAFIKAQESGEPTTRRTWLQAGYVIGSVALIISISNALHIFWLSYFTMIPPLLVLCKRLLPPKRT
jgi:hypothetical protein